MSIQIIIGDVSIAATLNDTKTARLVKSVLPFESVARLWGDEVYFEMPLEADEENAQAEVPFGAVGYWPPGKALCLFFGQQPYSPVNIVGHLDGDPKVLASAKDGDPVQVR